MSLHLIDTPTAGKRIAIDRVYSEWENGLETAIQERADHGWNFVGIIREEPMYLAGLLLHLLFVKD
jgi:hypothetical protein